MLFVYISWLPERVRQRTTSAAVRKTQGIRYQGKSERMDRKLLRLENNSSRGQRNIFGLAENFPSGVPQGRVIGPLLFLLYVNDLPDWIRNELKMFADDTKFWSRIKAVADSTILQQGLDSVCCWSDKWQIRFNVEKCKLMHIGHSVPTDYYMMEGTQKVPLKKVQAETDLGVVIRSDLKPTSQCNKSAAVERRIIAMVRRHFKKLDVEDFLLIYKTYIRPSLEFCIQSWSPFLDYRKAFDSVPQRTTSTAIGKAQGIRYQGKSACMDRRLLGLENNSSRDQRNIFGLAESCEWVSSRQRHWTTFIYKSTEGYRNTGKGPKNSNETGTSATKIQLWRAATETGINNTEGKETARGHDWGIQIIWRLGEDRLQTVLFLGYESL